MKINANQVKGVVSESLHTDLSNIYGQIGSYKAPVSDKSKLPTMGNKDGDMILSLKDDIIYIWDEPTKEWKPQQDLLTETIKSKILIESDNQTNFDTKFVVGVVNGISSLNSVHLEVNGVSQTKDIDFDLGLSGSNPKTLLITWKSQDFQLDKTDQLTMVFDMIIVK